MGLLFNSVCGSHKKYIIELGEVIYSKLDLQNKNDSDILQMINVGGKNKDIIIDQLHEQIEESFQNGKQSMEDIL